MSGDVSSRISWFSFERLLATLVFLTVGLACGLTPMHTDSWWQLRAGHDMWASHSVLLTDLYSHTEFGAFWPNHEWLSEVIFYALYRAGGLPLMTLAVSAIIVGAWGLSWRLGTGPARLRAIWLGPALISSSFWWQPRPHAFSLLFLMTAVSVLAAGRLWWLPAIFVVWANCHGGVLLGLAVIGAGLAVRVLRAPGQWRMAAAVFVLCVAATTATPLGFSFWFEIPKSLARIRLYPFDEWQRPTLTAPNLIPFWVIATIFPCALARFWRRLFTATQQDLTTYACALVVLPMAVSSIRHIGPFLMIAAPALTRLIPIQPRPEASAKMHRPLVNAAIMALAVVGVAATLAWAYVNRIPKLRWDPVPSGAIDALRACPDNLYNRYDQGGYLLWFVPERKVFLDGRQDPYPPALILQQIELENGGGAMRVFAEHHIRCAYLPAHSPTVAQLTTAGWRPLYQDASWVVLRND